MPALEESDFIDVAVLWPASSYDRYGKLTVEDRGIEIDCRWPGDSVTFGGGGQSDTEGVIAQVYVDREIGLGSVMWRGTLAELPTDGDFTNEWLYEVADYHELTDIRGDASRRWVDLTRYRGALPELAQVAE